MQTKKIENFLYFGDVHWSQYFKDFIQKYYDVKTKYISVWDLFDRGEFSYDVFEIIKNLHKEWKFEMVLWNHDLFFIFWKLYWVWVEKLNNMFDLNLSEEEYVDLNKLFSIFKQQYYWNGGQETDKSFYEAVFWNSYIKYMKKDSNFDTNDLYLFDNQEWLNNYIYENKEKLEIEFNNYCLEVVEFLFKSFKLFLVDDLNNLIVHWWMPILPNWDLVYEETNWRFIWWLELLSDYENKLKNFDYITIKKLSAYFDSFKDDIYLKMKNNWFLNWWKFYNDEAWYYIRTWYPNILYDKEDSVRETLIKELDKNKLNCIITGHYRNEFIGFRETHRDQRYYRLERNYIKNDNFWYLIMNLYWEVLEIDDVVNILD